MVSGRNKMHIKKPLRIPQRLDIGCKCDIIRLERGYCASGYSTIGIRNTDNLAEWAVFLFM